MQGHYLALVELAAVAAAHLWLVGSPVTDV